MLSLNLSHKDGIFEDNIVQNTLNAAVCEYLTKNPYLTLKIRILGKLGVGKTTLIVNYLNAKVEKQNKTLGSSKTLPVVMSNTSNLSSIRSFRLPKEITKGSIEVNSSDNNIIPTE